MGSPNFLHRVKSISNAPPIMLMCFERFLNRSILQVCLVYFLRYKNDSEKLPSL